MKKILGVTVAGVVLLLGGALLAKNMLAKTALTRGVKMMTGLDLRIRGVDVGLLNTRIGVQGLQVLNPSGFHEPVMVDLPDVQVHVDAQAWLRGKVHLPEVRVNLKELDVIQNERGEVNLNALRVMKQAGERRRAPETKPAQPSKPTPIQVDVLDLAVGTVWYKDYTTTPPHMIEFPVNLHERFANVTNPQALVGLIVTRALAKTTISSLAHLDVNALQAEMSRLVDSSLQKALGVVGQGTLDSTGQAVENVSGRLKKLFGQ